MQHNDDVVSGWLSGEDSIDNPAGPLYLEGRESTEAALTQSFRATVSMICASLQGSTTCSFGGGCACC